jgi:hypothetical protein
MTEMTLERIAELETKLKAAHPLPWGEVGGVRGNANRLLVEAAINALPALLTLARRALELEAALKWHDGVSADEYLERSRILGFPGLGQK